jgi:hypothetical protein
LINPLSGGNVAGVTTLLAGERGVLALKRIARLVVIERLLGRFPVDQLKVLAVVFRMTPHAIPAGALRAENRAMEA